MKVKARDVYVGLINFVSKLCHLYMVYSLRENSHHTQLGAIRVYIMKLKAYASNHIVAFLKYDNAAEYVGRDIASYCKQNDILQKLSTP